MKGIAGILLTLLFFSSTGLAQKDGIDFFKGNWEEALTEAAKHKKLIFVDAYTSWCGPCKRMAKDIFPKKEVGSFYNQNFINLKIDMEKGEGPKIARKFRVNSYPTFLFVDANGELVHRALGMVPANKFILSGQEALRKNDKSPELGKKYEAGNREPQLLRDYAYALKQGARVYLKIANEYLRSQKDLETTVNLEFIFDFANEADSRIFDLLLEHRKKIIALKGKASFKQKVEQACSETIRKAIEFKNEELLNEAKAKMKKFNSKEAKAFAYKADMEYYLHTGGKEKYIKACDNYIKKVAKNQPTEIYNIVQSFDWNVDDKVGLKKAEKWAKKLIKLDGQYAYYHIYASILAKNGKTKEALKAANLAVEKAASENTIPTATKALIQKLQN